MAIVGTYLRQTNIAMENPSFEDVIISYWNRWISIAMLVYWRGIYVKFHWGLKIFAWQDGWEEKMGVYDDWKSPMNDLMCFLCFFFWVIYDLYF